MHAYIPVMKEVSTIYFFLIFKSQILITEIGKMVELNCFGAQ